MHCTSCWAFIHRLRCSVYALSYFGTVSSLLQAVDSHGLWGGLTDGLPSTLGSSRSGFERDRTSFRCPPYAALTSVEVLEMTRRRDCLMTPHFLIWSFGPKIGPVDAICHQTVSMNIFYLDVKTGSYSWDSSQFPRRRPFLYLKPPFATGPVPSLSGHAIAYRLSDGVHCRESAGTGPVALKVVPVTGAAFASLWSN